MRGWLFIKSITPDILPISIDRGFFLLFSSHLLLLLSSFLLLSRLRSFRIRRSRSPDERRCAFSSRLVVFFFREGKRDFNRELDDFVAQESRSRIESRRGFSKEISEETGCCSSVGDENGSVFLFASNDHPKIAAATRTHAPFPLGAP